MIEASFMVEGPPRTWKRAMSRFGVRFTPPEMREYQAHVLACWQQSRAGQDPWPKEARYELAIAIVPPDRRRADIDNYVKTVCDALNGYAWVDDSQIDRLRVDRLPPDKPGTCIGVHIRIIEAEPESEPELDLDPRELF
jgi:Holliday junction resolvase RusA-like endonuclease